MVDIVDVVWRSFISWIDDIHRQTIGSRGRINICRDFIRNFYDNIRPSSQKGSGTGKATKTKSKLIQVCSPP